MAQSKRRNLGTGYGLKLFFPVSLKSPTGHLTIARTNVAHGDVQAKNASERGSHPLLTNRSLLLICIMRILDKNCISNFIKKLLLVRHYSA